MMDSKKAAELRANIALKVQPPKPSLPPYAVKKPKQEASANVG